MEVLFTVHVRGTQRQLYGRTGLISPRAEISEGSWGARLKSMSKDENEIQCSLGNQSNSRNAMSASSRGSKRQPPARLLESPAQGCTCLSCHPEHISMYQLPPQDLDLLVAF